MQHVAPKRLTIAERTDRQVDDMLRVFDMTDNAVNRGLLVLLIGTWGPAGAWGRLADLARDPEAQDA